MGAVLISEFSASFIRDLVQVDNSFSVFIGLEWYQYTYITDYSTS